MLIEKYQQKNLKKKKKKEITAYSGFRKKKKAFPYILCIWVKDKCAFHTKNYFFTNTSAI